MPVAGRVASGPSLKEDVDYRHTVFLSCGCQPARRSAQRSAERLQSAPLSLGAGDARRPAHMHSLLLELASQGKGRADSAKGRTAGAVVPAEWS